MVFTILIFYGLSTLSLFKMRKDNIGGTDIFRVPFYPVLPIVFVMVILVLLFLRAMFEWQNSATDLVFIVTGLPFAIYWIRKKGRSGETGA